MITPSKDEPILASCQDEERARRGALQPFNTEKDRLAELVFIHFLLVKSD